MTKTEVLDQIFTAKRKGIMSEEVAEFIISLVMDSDLDVDNGEVFGNYPGDPK